MGENFQKSALPTFLQFVRVRAAHQPHMDATVHRMTLALARLLPLPDSSVFATSITCTVVKNSHIQFQKLNLIPLTIC